ncbi:MAG: HNH endonuclease [Planctomycetota bacterium]|nr:HNH endonuclease [Planctomycetota bacterium]
MGILDWLFPSRKRERESNAPVRVGDQSPTQASTEAAGDNQMTDEAKVQPQKPLHSYDKPGGLSGGVLCAFLKDGDGPKDAGEFRDHYELLASKMVPVFEENADKEVLGKRAGERLCRVCGRKAPVVKFRTEAHVIPRSLGNRWLVTQQECDECNGRYGREHDDELAKMLLPMLALLRIPGRNGPPAFKARGLVSRIGGEDNLGRLKIELSELDKSIRTEERSGNRFDLIFDGVNWNPTAALKSIARSTWHLLDEASHGRFDFIIRWIKGETSLYPVSYHHLHFPGPGFANVYLDVWQRKSDAKSAPLVVQLTVGSTGIVLHLHDCAQEIEWWPVPPQPLTDCPPFAASGKRLSIQKDGRARFSNYRITMSYAKKIDMVIADESGSDLDQAGDLIAASNTASELERLFSTPVVPVAAETRWQGQPVNVRTLAKCTLLPTDEDASKAASLPELLQTTSGELPSSRRLKLTLAGGELGATFWLETGSDGRNQFGITPDLHSVPPEAAINTVRLIDALQKSEGLRVTDDQGNVVFTVAAGATSSDSIDDERTSATLELLDALALINSRCKADLRYPASSVASDDADRTLMIATLLREGVAGVRVPEGELQNAKVPIKTVEEWETLASRADEFELAVSTSDEPFVVFGRKVSVGKWKLSLGGVRILIPDEEREAVREKLEAGQPCEIPIRHTLRIIDLVAQGSN